MVALKIITIIGARPQFIKAAVISRAIKQWNQEHVNAELREVIIHTGQHYDANMSKVFFEEMSIPQPKYQLHVGGGTHGTMTGQMLEKIEEVLLQEKPNAVLVYGDTDSTLAGALAAVKLHVPVAHVEAGLRSFNMLMPEEVNRILTDRISKWLFCPTQTAVVNLEQEGYKNFGAVMECVGDVMQDAALFYRKQHRSSANIQEVVRRFIGKFYLATVHRAENTDDKAHLENIIEALDAIAEHVPVVLPLHPRTKKMLSQYGISVKHITLIPPIGYFDMIYLQEHCSAIFTDSGGVQKEAYFFQKPCITLRDETEWTELVKHGVNQLVGADQEKILCAEQYFRNHPLSFDQPLYGDGHAGEKIVKYLIEGLS